MFCVCRFDFKGIIDYIFLSRDFMRPLGVLGPLDPEWFRQYKVIGCPHPHIPSDHLPLLVEIEMGLAPAVLNPPRGQNTQPPAASSSSSSGLSRSTRS
jgi:CCR4-NOT transcription complex subunit 6